MKETEKCTQDLAILIYILYTYIYIYYIYTVYVYIYIQTITLSMMVYVRFLIHLQMFGDPSKVVFALAGQSIGILIPHEVENILRLEPQNRKVSNFRRIAGKNCTGYNMLSPKSKYGSSLDQSKQPIWSMKTWPVLFPPSLAPTLPRLPKLDAPCVTASPLGWRHAESAAPNGLTPRPQP